MGIWWFQHILGMFFIMTVHDVMKGESSNTTEYCKKYDIFASPDCW
jgi:hypothetical protein